MCIARLKNTMWFTLIEPYRIAGVLIMTQTRSFRRFAYYIIVGNAFTIADRMRCLLRTMIDTRIVRCCREMLFRVYI